MRGGGSAFVPERPPLMVTSEEADARISAILRGRAAAWVRRFTIEQCALIAERAVAGKAMTTRKELESRVMQIADAIRAAGKKHGEQEKEGHGKVSEKVEQAAPMHRAGEQGSGPARGPAPSRHLAKRRTSLDLRRDRA